MGQTLIPSVSVTRSGCPSSSHWASHSVQPFLFVPVKCSYSECKAILGKGGDGTRAGKACQGGSVTCPCVVCDPGLFQQQQQQQQREALPWTCVTQASWLRPQPPSDPRPIPHTQRLTIHGCPCKNQRGRQIWPWLFAKLSLFCMTHSWQKNQKIQISKTKKFN